jgi:hypothetical protein
MGNTAPSFQVNVEVGDVTLDTVIGTHLIDRGDDEEHVPFTLRDLIVKEFLRKMAVDSTFESLRRAIESIRQTVIREIVEETVRAILAEPFTPTNAYGEKRGELWTLREHIAAQAAAALKVRTEIRGGGYGTESVVDKVIREETGSVLSKELAAAMKEERTKAVALMHAKAAEVIATMLAAGVPGGR